jgi:hypothetical protein
LGRYDDKANPDNPEAGQLREAAAELSTIQKAIVALLRTYAEGSEPISEAGLDDFREAFGLDSYGVGPVGGWFADSSG